MAENDSDERTEAATPRRREEARKKGQVVRSRELVTAAITIGGAVGLMIFGDNIALSVMDVSRRAFRMQGIALAHPEDLPDWFANALAAVGFSVLPLLVCIALAALAGSIAIGGFAFSGDQIMPKFDRMSPLKGFKRMFGLQAVVELVKGMGKFVVVGLFAFMVLRHYSDDFLLLGRHDLGGTVAHAADLLLRAFLFVSLSLLIIVVIDAPYQMWNFARELRMSKQEIREEYKEMEGKPEVRSRIRRMQREISQRKMMSEVPKADVVITNPSHFAVALKYDPTGPGAPRVLAKGADLMALQIRRVATANGVYVLESPPLARALYHSCEIDREIPEGLYLAVAQVLAYVFGLRQHKKARPPNPDELPIPDDLKR